MSDGIKSIVEVGNATPRKWKKSEKNRAHKLSLTPTLAHPFTHFNSLNCGRQAKNAPNCQ